MDFYIMNKNNKKLNIIAKKIPESKIHNIDKDETISSISIRLEYIDPNRMTWNAFGPRYDALNFAYSKIYKECENKNLKPSEIYLSYIITNEQTT